MNRRMFLLHAGAVFGFAAAALAMPLTAFAHHGWGWAEGDKSELTGTVTEARLGNPHGELTLDVDGESWVVEVGQPWRNDRAGLTAEMLEPGTTVTAIGNRSTNPEERLLKAVAIVIDGKEHVLYPGRMS